MVYAVNDISFHPVHGTFSTCGKYFFMHSLCLSCSFNLQVPTVPFTSGIRMPAPVWRVRLIATFLSSMFWIISFKLSKLHPALLHAARSIALGRSSPTLSLTIGLKAILVWRLDTLTSSCSMLVKTTKWRSAQESSPNVKFLYLWDFSMFVTEVMNVWSQLVTSICKYWFWQFRAPILIHNDTWTQSARVKQH